MSESNVAVSPPPLPNIYQQKHPASLVLETILSSRSKFEKFVATRSIIRSSIVKGIITKENS